MLGWAGYTAYMVVHNTTKFASASVIKVLLVMPLCAGIFYGVRHILRTADRRNRWCVGLVRLLLFFVAGIGIAYGYVYGLAPLLGVPIHVPGKAFSMTVFLRTVFLFFFRFSMYALTVFLMEKLVEHINEKRRYRAQIAALKANNRLLALHFMGNVLQRCYRLLHSMKPHAARAFARADGLIQYVLEVQGKDVDTGPLVMLQREVGELENIMALDDANTADGPQVELEVRGELAGYKVPPLLFLTGYENILKHGVTDDPRHPARIQVKIEAGRIYFRTYNRIAKQTNAGGRGGGWGLDVVQKQLRLKFGDKCGFTYRRQNGRFLLHLWAEP